jgi:hypothetical protein
MDQCQGLNSGEKSTCKTTRFKEYACMTLVKQQAVVALNDTTQATSRWALAGELKTADLKDSSALCGALARDSCHVARHSFNADHSCPP